MIEKPSIVVTSIGRTGTKFFYALFKEILPDGTVLHEPDVLNIVQYEGMARRIEELGTQIRESGAYNLLVRKALGRWSLIELSDARVRGTLEAPGAIEAVLDQRQRFVRSRPGSVYVESNVGYYGLADILKETHRHCRVVYLVRDGRDWVRSNMNWGQMYGKGSLRALVAHTWPTAPEIPADPDGERWEAMTRFERLCWAWARLNGYALQAVAENWDAQVFKFEEIFKSESGYDALERLIRFATQLPGLDGFEPRVEGWLDRQIHRSKPGFPDWPSWSARHREAFWATCGPLMEELGYA